MKKSLSLIAIVGLLLSIGLVSIVSANAPVYPDVPDVKLFTNNVGLTPAFDLAQFNVAADAYAGDIATSYSITADFNGLSSLTASAWSGHNSNVQVGGYGSATSGSNSFTMANAGGIASASNKVKFSTYKINKLPKVGLSVGESYSVNVASYASNAAGSALPPSFGNATALIVSDTTKVTATWSDRSTVAITLIAAAAGPVNVDVIASPVASGVSTDIDKERIQVYTNLQAFGRFTASSDTAVWKHQVYGAGPNVATLGWSAGAMTLSAADATVFDKMTPDFPYWINFSAGQWYTVRMKISADAANTHVLSVFGLSTSVGAGYNGAIGANVLIGLPTVATWVEAPFYVNVAQTGSPQLAFHATGAGTLTINEIQVINAGPTLVDASRGNTRNFYTGGIFKNAASTTLWGVGASSPGSTGFPSSLTLVPDATIGSALSVNFAGAVTGFKWTAATSLSGLYTPAATVGREVGARAQVTNPTGLTGGVAELLVAVYGIPTNGALSPLNQVIAAAQVGTIVPGTVRAIGVATQPFYQLQFVTQSNVSGTMNIANVDFDSDNDDPNFGSSSLFP